MGCASSRVMHLQAEKDDAPVDSGGSPTPTPKKSRKRRYGEHEQQPQQQHIVELTSSTYGILELNNPRPDQQHLDASKCLKHKNAAAAVADRTPSKVRGFRDSVAKPEVINTLELMEGLEAGNLELGFSSPLSSSKLHRRSLSLSAVHAAQMVQAVLSNKEAAAGLQLLLRDMHSSNNVGSSKAAVSKQQQKQRGSDDKENVRPREDFYVMSQTSQHPRGSSSSSTTTTTQEEECWTSNKKRCLSSKASNSLQVSPVTSPYLNGADSPPLFDPELLETIERAFEQISEEDWYSARRSNGAFVSTSRSVSPDQIQRPALVPLVKASKGNKIPAGCSFKQKSSEEAQSCKATSYEIEQNDEMLQSFQLLCPPGGEGKAVVYFTSLRGVRNTFEECTSVLTILRGYGVSIDERDVSMHLGFRHELKELFGSSKPVQVPKLFVKGRFIGGAPEVSRLHDEGSLSKLLEGIGREDPGKLCDGCGGARFVLCLDCSGSCKVLMDDAKGTTRCLECNENGLIRCPICC